jgi:hypothetical protein
MAARVAFFTILAAIIYGVPEDVPPAQARSTTATVKAEAAAAQRFAAPPLFPVRISGRHLIDKTACLSWSLGTHRKQSSIFR